MKKLFFACLFFPVIFSAQQLNLKEVKTAVTEIGSPLYYDKLIEEFRKYPQNFLEDSSKSINLYYGKLFSPYYSIKIDKKSDYIKFTRLISKKKYKEALELGKELVEKDPVNLSVLINMLVAYKELDKDNFEIGKIETQIKALMQSIAEYGDGKTKETSFKVISLGDEFALLKYLDINIDKYKVVSKTNKLKNVLDAWVKDKAYTADNRNKIFVQILSDKL